jgi:hypothetical protein
MNAAFGRTLLAACGIDFSRELDLLHKPFESRCRRTRGNRLLALWAYVFHKNLFLEKGNVFSAQIHRHALNLGHVVVLNRTRVTVTPINGRSTPRRSNHCANVGCRPSPADTI